MQCELCVTNRFAIKSSHIYYFFQISLKRNKVSLKCRLQGKYDKTRVNVYIYEVIFTNWGIK